MAKYNESETNNTISEYIYNEYITGMELNETQKLISDLPLLVDNNLACVINGFEDLTYSFNLTYRIACKMIQKYNKNLIKNRKVLKDIELGGKDNVFAKNDASIIKLARKTLDAGTYLAQLTDTEYMVIKSSYDKEDPYTIEYSIYFIGYKWKKWRDKFYELVNRYDEIKKKEKLEMIRYTNGKPSTTVIFKPFDQVIFSEKEDTLRYIDNWVKNIPVYYNEYNMVAKLSIMLYGNPGTGKSTFAKALANYLEIQTVTCVTPDYFDCDNDYMNGGRGRNSANYTYSPTVFSIDDIDCICKSREIEKSKENDETLANLLSFLDNPPTFYFKAKDGVRYPVSIVVASTNYYDKLDDAVKRYGRFDLNIEMLEFDKKEAQLMCDIYKLKLEDIVKDSNKKDFRISPSKLQALCLENIDKSMKKI